MKKTRLYDTHIQLGGKIIEFGGWLMPVQYSGILDEHAKVRSAAGLFDVSHMGEIRVRGPEAERFVQRIVTNDVSQAEDFQVVYSPMCDPDGGTVDDLIIYKFGKDDYLLVVNAANTGKDYNWLVENLEEEAVVENVSDKYAQLALQGPKAQAILQKLADMPLDNIRFFRFQPEVDIGGIKALVSRTGYTGEDGFELYIDAGDAVALWEKLMEAGREEGLVPAGLGARDTLRLEAALPLYGHELSESISPLEAGLERFVKLDKGGFIGRDALAAQLEQGVARKLAGFEMVDRGIPRNSYEVRAGGKTVGYVTSGSFSPSLGKNIGLALVGSEYSEPGTEFNVIVRDRPLKAVTVKIPFYKKKYKSNQ